MQSIYIVGKLTNDAKKKNLIVQGNEREFVFFEVAVNERSNNTVRTTLYECTMFRTDVFKNLKKDQTVALNGLFIFYKHDIVNEKGDTVTYTHLLIRVAHIEPLGYNRPIPKAIIDIKDEPEAQWLKGQARELDFTFKEL